MLQESSKKPTESRDPPTTALKVVILDGNYYASVGMQALLEKDRIEVVGITRNPEEVMELVESKQPDVVIIDLEIRGDYIGVKIIEAIKEKHSQIKCIIQTTVTSNLTYLIRAITTGAEGFIGKDTLEQPPFLGQVVKTVALGGKYYDAELHDKVILNINPTGIIEPISTSIKNPMTKREREILKEVAEGASNLGIADKFHISEPTVKTHLSNIYSKLEAKGRLEAVMFARLNKWL